MKRTSLKPHTLKARCNKVFLSNWYDIYTDCYINNEGQLVVEMEDKRDGLANERIPFEFIPDMSNRPQAVSYLMGERDDFND